LEPFGCTVAPTTGEPSFESVTLPVIVFDWEKPVKNERRRRKPIDTAFVMKILVFFIQQ
jgi:hypothetical protein